MTRDLVIFGTGSFAEVAQVLFDEDTDHRVVGFTVHRDHIEADTFRGRPLVPFEEVMEHFPPERTDLFVAVGYKDVNRLRARLCDEARGHGYRLATYVSPRASVWKDLKIGDNCFIFEDNTIQPFVEIGDDTILWSGNHIGHHSRIGSHCFITSHVVISGHVTVGDNCFIGVNATLRDAIQIGAACVIGAGALIMKSTKDKEVYVEPRTKPDTRSSDEIGM